MIRLVSLILFFSVTASIVEASEFQIRKVSKSRTKVLIKKSTQDSIRRGSQFTIEFEDGGQCILKALKVKGKAALLSARSCKNRKKIRKGMLITLLDPSEKIEGSVSAGSQSKGTTKNLGVGLHYNMASEIAIEGTDISASSDYDAVASGAIGLSVEYVSINPGSLGFSAGFGYELSRDFEGAIGLINGIQLNGAYSPQPSLGLMYLHGNLNYALNANLYFTGGLNYSLLSLDQLGTYEASGGIGFQIGGGYLINDSMGVELLYKTINGSLTNSSFSNVDLTASLSGIHIGFRYLFF